MKKFAVGLNILSEVAVLKDLQLAHDLKESSGAMRSCAHHPMRINFVMGLMSEGS